MAATSAIAGKGVIAIALIIGIVVGFSVGFITPGLLPRPPTASYLAEIKQRGYIVIGTSSGWPPFEMFNETSQQLYGFDIDLCEYIADYIGVAVHWSDLSFADLIAQCTTGQIDMIAAATFIEPDRAEVLAFSIPYIRVNEVIIVKNDSTLAITNLTQLAGYTVGVQTGTAEDLELTYLVVNQSVPITLTRFDRPDILMADLIGGGLDAAYVDEPVFTVYSKTYALKIIYTVLAPPTAFYCRWENPDLLAAVNAGLLQAYTDGTLDALIAEWFG